MGLFDKKFCDVCGEKIGLLGNRKLEDGNLCKDCAKKLSPFFSERRHSTVAQIKEQLAYREQNKQVLANFRPTITLGDTKKIYVDQTNGTFVVSYLAPDNWTDENPDVMQLSQIVNCGLDIKEDKDEIYTRNAEGKTVSYSPPRYKYYYNFDINFIVNHPFFDDFSVRLNTLRVEGMGSMEYNRYQQKAMDIINTLKPMNTMPNMGMHMNPGFSPANSYSQPVNNGYVHASAYAQAAQPVQEGWTCACGAVNKGKFCAECGAKKPSGTPIYQCDKCGWKPENPNSAPKFCPECGDIFNENDVK
jgi:hypothetical protein